MEREELSLSPFPLSLHFLILFPFHGSFAAAGCDSLVWEEIIIKQVSVEGSNFFLKESGDDYV